MQKILIMMVCLLVVAAPVAAERLSMSDGAVPAADTFQGFLAPLTRPDEAEEVKQLVVAVKAIEDRWSRMTDQYRERIARAALKASKATGVDATLLVAVARQESDFQGMQSLHPRCRDPRYDFCQADCGVTQHHVRGPRRWVIKRCTQLAQDFDESFLLSAKEIRHHIDWCQKNAKWQAPIQRCVLARYNAGPFYPTPHRCSQGHATCQQTCMPVDWNDPDMDRKQRHYSLRQACLNRCYVAQRKCRFRANYWIGVLCFDYGARRGLKATRSCRYVWSLAAIPAQYPTSEDSASATK